MKPEERNTSNNYISQAVIGLIVGAILMSISLIVETYYPDSELKYSIDDLVITPEAAALSITLENTGKRALNNVEIILPYSKADESYLLEDGDLSQHQISDKELSCLVGSVYYDLAKRDSLCKRYVKTLKETKLTITEPTYPASIDKENYELSILVGVVRPSEKLNVAIISKETAAGILSSRYTINNAIRIVSDEVLGQFISFKGEEPYEATSPTESTLEFLGFIMMVVSLVILIVIIATKLEIRKRDKN
jgi:hypothetical protein